MSTILIIYFGAAIVRRVCKRIIEKSNAVVISFLSVTLQWHRSFLMLMGNFDWGPISRNDIVSRKSRVSRNKKIRQL